VGFDRSGITSPLSYKSSLSQEYSLDTGSKQASRITAATHLSKKSAVRSSRIVKIRNTKIVQLLNAIAEFSGEPGLLFLLRLQIKSEYRQNHAYQPKP
jgi:hypothetical protein